MNDRCNLLLTKNYASLPCCCGSASPQSPPPPFAPCKKTYAGTLGCFLGAFAASASLLSLISKQGCMQLEVGGRDVLRVEVLHARGSGD